MDWSSELDLTQAIANLRFEARGDWYRDPWSWPEYEYLTDTAGQLLWRHLRKVHVPGQCSLLDVPKENFGVRPAVQLDILDRISYQCLVDALSVPAVQSLRPEVLGWRLPMPAQAAGAYAPNGEQWRSYRARLGIFSMLYSAGLKADVTSFFASIPSERLFDELAMRVGGGAIVDRVEGFIAAWQQTTGRTGLPQRSLASSVLANMYLSPVDDVLEEHAQDVPAVIASYPSQLSFARWMDDVWLFGDDVGRLRAAQVDLQIRLGVLGLALNSAKTRVYEGADLAAAARKVEHSAVDAAYSRRRDERPLEELVDRILEERERIDPTTVRFAAFRMRKWKMSYRLDELVRTAERLPHCADSLSRLLKKRLPPSEVQDWYLDYLASPWNVFEWATAQFGTALRSGKRPRRSVVETFERMLMAEAGSLPSIALAAQRLAAWDPHGARALIAERSRHESSPQILRVLALSALTCGEEPRRIRRLLNSHRENDITLRMLEHRSFAPLSLSRDYR